MIPTLVGIVSTHDTNTIVGIVSTHDTNTSGDSEHMIPTLVGIVRSRSLIITISQSD